MLGTVNKLACGMQSFNVRFLIFHREEYQGRLSYYIPVSNMKLSTMFGIMEADKDALNIESYSLSQTSLEQIFLSFTKYQDDERL